MKKFLAIFMAVCMLLSVLAACGQDNAEAPAPGAEGSAPAAPNAPAEEQVENTVITWYFVGAGTTQENMDRINAAGTKMLNDAGIPAQLDIKFLSWADYSSTYANMLASGEEFDILNDMNSTFIGYGKNGGIYEISDEDLATYLPDVPTTMGASVVEAFRCEGVLWGIPCAHEFAQYSSMEYNADMAKKYGFDMSAVKTIEDLFPIFETLAADGIYGVYLYDNGNDNLLVTANHDPVNNDPNLCLGFDATVEYNPVHNTFENEKVVAALKMYREWYEKGWALGSTEVDTAAEFKQTQKVFGVLNRSKPGTAAQTETSTAFDVESIYFRDGEAVRTTGDFPGGWGHAISATSSDPVLAMQVLNFAYANQDFINLICYGEKDVDYTVNENGYVVIGETGYGRDCNGTMNWEFANSFGATPQQVNVDQGLGELGAITAEFNDGATQLAHSGFYFDLTDYAAEVAAVKAVANEYVKALMHGQFEDVEATIAELNEALYDNGLQTLIDAANEQYDAFRGA